MRRDDWQVCEWPFTALDLGALRGHQLEQVSDGRRQYIFVVFIIVTMARESAQGAGDVVRHRGLFRNDQPFAAEILFHDSARCFGFGRSLGGFFGRGFRGANGGRRLQRRGRFDTCRGRFFFSCHVWMCVQRGRRKAGNDTSMPTGWQGRVPLTAVKTSPQVPVKENILAAELFASSPARPVLAR